MKCQAHHGQCLLAAEVVVIDKRDQARAVCGQCGVNPSVWTQAAPGVEPAVLSAALLATWARAEAAIQKNAQAVIRQAEGTLAHSRARGWRVRAEQERRAGQGSLELEEVA